jgi:transcriptional regulator with XRE-family HTH domain
MSAGQPGGSAGSELGRFLRARRTQLRPDEAGITVGPGWRRTPGLRREELASLAGVSVDYYIRLERGTEVRPSPAVVDALARALQLGETDYDYLCDLAARAARVAVPHRTMPRRQMAGPGAELLLERLRPYPARVLSRTMDLLAWNPGGLGMVPGIENWPVERRNIARYVFLHPAARALFADRELVTGGCVARLRALAGIEPEAADLTEPVEELMVKSAEFARVWERFEVRPYTLGSKTMHHPEVGEVSLDVQSLQIEGSPGHRLVIYYAEPGTRDHDAIVLLDRIAHDQAATVLQPQPS